MSKRNRIFTCLASIHLLILSLLLSIPLTYAQSVEFSRAQHIAKLATQANPQAKALPLLWHLQNNTSLLSNTDRAQIYNELEKHFLHPTIAIYLKLQREKWSFQAANPQNINNILDLGFLIHWNLIGPFYSDITPELLTDCNPQNHVPASKFGSIPWIKYDALYSNAILAPANKLTNLKHSAIFLTTNIQSNKKQQIKIAPSINSAYIMWLNGKRITESNEERAILPTIDTDLYTIELQKGNNTLLIQANIEENNPLFYIRLTDLNNNPIRLKHTQDDVHCSQNYDNQINTTPEPSIHKQLLESNDTHPAQKSLILSMTTNSKNSHLANQWALQALKDENIDDEHFIMALHNLDETWQIKYYLQHKIEKSSNSPTILFEYLENELTNITSILQSELDNKIQKAQSNYPNALKPLLLRANYHQQAGLKNLAKTQLLPYKEKYHDNLAFLSILQQLSPEELQPCLDLIKYDATNPYYRLAAVELLIKNNKPNDALQLINDGLTLNPDDEELKLKKIELLSLKPESQQEALSFFKNWMESTPFSPELWIKYAYLLQNTSNDLLALKALKQSLIYAPQNESIKQLVDHLSQEKKSYEDDFIITDIKPYEKGDVATYISLIDQRITQIMPNGLTSTFTQIALQVLDDEGLRTLRNIPIFYAPLEEELEIISIKTIKKDGSIKRTFDKNESSVSDESIRMYYDLRRVVITIPDLAVGDIIEFKYKRTQNDKAILADRYFSDIFNLSSSVPKQYQRYIVLAPKDLQLKFQLPKSFNDKKDDASYCLIKSPTDADNCKSLTLKDKNRLNTQNIYAMTWKNEPLTINESMAPGWAEISNILSVSTFSTWEDVSKWYYKLAHSQWVIDNDIKNEVDKLTKNITDDRQKITNIYNYLVKSTRYVALEFGIHGFKPYQTTQTFRRRFGDCKDKASLLKVMLEYAGIPSNFVLIRTADLGAINTDLPNLHIFNHAILYVPKYKLFLDGTAENSGSSELPFQDQNTIALIVGNENEPHSLLITPQNQTHQNQATINSNISAENDRLIIQNTTTYTGQFAPPYRNDYQTGTKQHENFEHELTSELPGAKLQKVEFPDIDNLEKNVTINYTASIALSSILEETTKEYKIKPLLQTVNFLGKFTPTASRLYDLKIPYPFIIKYNINFKLPQNLSSLQTPAPQDLSFENEFAKASLKTSIQNNIYTAIFTWTITNTRIPRDKYDNFQLFIRNIERTLNTPILWNKQ